MTATSRFRRLGWLPLLALALLCTHARPAAATVPTLMNYQGFLTDNTNAPSTGTFQMKFALYSDSLTGSLLWQETYASVSVTSGVFNVVLGTAAPLPPTVFSGATLWLQTTVNGSDILPRRAVVSVAYAIHAGSADPTTGTIIGQVQSTCGPSVDGMLIYIPGRSFVVYAAANGTFQLDHVPPGTYTVRFNAGTYDATNVTVTAGGTTNLGIVTLGPNTQTDPANCGSCGNVCSSNNGTASCTAGTCQITCNSGYLNCDNVASNGCEKNIANDPQNCGGCGVACFTPNATPACSGGTCTIGSCNSGFANCNGVSNDGCEKNLNTDVQNCGNCNLVCFTPNASPACINGQCAVGSCNTNYLNCNGQTADGCEINKMTNNQNCGSCGHACAGNQTCVAGVCQ